MAERVRRFRVKSAAGYGCFGVKTGDTGELVEMHGSSVRLTSPRWHLKTVLFDPAYVEELPAFAVGDAVRVKAGNWEKCPTVGAKLIVERVEGRLVRANGYLCADISNLEPWNDAEEWDGSKWVAKKPAPKFKNGDRVKIVGPPTWMESKRTGQTHTIEHVFPMGHEGQHSYDLDCDVPASYPESSLMLVCEWTVKPDSTPKPAIVCLREDGKLDTRITTVHGSTDAAFEDAQALAEDNPGKEFVVLQEKGSKRVWPTSKAKEFAESVMQRKDNKTTINKKDGTREAVVAKSLAVETNGNEVVLRYTFDS